MDNVQLWSGSDTHVMQQVYVLQSADTGAAVKVLHTTRSRCGVEL